jgi:hypothetical protein
MIKQVATASPASHGHRIGTCREAQVAGVDDRRPATTRARVGGRRVSPAGKTAANPKTTQLRGAEAPSHGRTRVLSNARANVYHPAPTKSSHHGVSFEQMFDIVGPAG